MRRIFLQDIQKEITERHILNLIHPQDVQKGTERQVMIYIDVLYCVTVQNHLMTLMERIFLPQDIQKGRQRQVNELYKCTFIGYYVATAYEAGESLNESNGEESTSFIMYI